MSGGRVPRRPPSTGSTQPTELREGYGRGSPGVTKNLEKDSWRLTEGRKTDEPVRTLVLGPWPKCHGIQAGFRQSTSNSSLAGNNSGRVDRRGVPEDDL